MNWNDGERVDEATDLLTVSLQPVVTLGALDGAPEGEALARVGINIDLISTSEIRISVLIKDSELDKAVAALHEAFNLGGDEEAVVYAGTGR